MRGCWVLLLVALVAEPHFAAFSASNLAAQETEDHLVNAMDKVSDGFLRDSQLDIFDKHANTLVGLSSKLTPYARKLFAQTKTSTVNLCEDKTGACATRWATQYLIQSVLLAIELVKIELDGTSIRTGMVPLLFFKKSAVTIFELRKTFDAATVADIACGGAKATATAGFKLIGQTLLDITPPAFLVFDALGDGYAPLTTDEFSSRIPVTTNSVLLIFGVIGIVLKMSTSAAEHAELSHYIFGSDKLHQVWNVAFAVIVITMCMGLLFTFWGILPGFGGPTQHPDRQTEKIVGIVMGIIGAVGLAGFRVRSRANAPAKERFGIPALILVILIGCMLPLFLISDEVVLRNMSMVLPVFGLLLVLFLTGYQQHVMIGHTPKTIADYRFQCQVGASMLDNKVCPKANFGTWGHVVQKMTCKEITGDGCGGEGWFMLHSFDGNKKICAKCGEGYQQVTVKGLTECSVCEPGTVFKNGNCVDCAAGTFWHRGQCKGCPRGQVSKPKSTQCTACPAGKTANKDKSDCVDIPPKPAKQAKQPKPANKYLDPKDKGSTGSTGSTLSILPTTPNTKLGHSRKPTKP